MAGDLDERVKCVSAGVKILERKLKVGVTLMLNEFVCSRISCFAICGRYLEVNASTVSCKMEWMYWRAI